MNATTPTRAILALGLLAGALIAAAPAATADACTPGRDSEIDTVTLPASGSGVYWSGGSLSAGSTDLTLYWYNTEVTPGGPCVLTIEPVPAQSQCTPGPQGEQRVPATLLVPSEGVYARGGEVYVGGEQRYVDVQRSNTGGNGAPCVATATPQQESGVEHEECLTCPV